MVGGPQLGEDSIQHLKLPRSSVQVRTEDDKGELVTKRESVCFIGAEMTGPTPGLSRQRILNVQRTIPAGQKNKTKKTTTLFLCSQELRLFSSK